MARQASVGAQLGTLIAVLLAALAAPGCSSDTAPQNLESWVLVEHRQVREEATVTGTVVSPVVGSVYAFDDGRLTADVATVALQLGSVLTRVNGRAVVVVKMDQPPYRALSMGSEGSDVVELRKVLVALGADVPTASPRFDEGLDAAVRAWQASLGSLVDGVVNAGDLAPLEELPCALRTSLRKGDLVHPGDVVAQCVRETPVVVAMVSASLRDRLTPGMAVWLTDGEQEIGGVLEDVATVPVVSEDGSMRYRVVAAPDGEFGASDGATSSIRVELRDFGEGTAVPSAAIHEGITGQLVVDARNGSSSEVRQVVVQARGSDGTWTLVTGQLTEADEVRVGKN